MDTERTDWRDEAACLHVDPDLFFPFGTAGPALRQVDEAKRICRTCPVRTPCLTWALDQANSSGIWGGTTEDERRAIRRTAISRVHRREGWAGPSSGPHPASQSVEQL
jgi:WhiB family redox-sensing transcriptional regulator